MRYSLEDGSFHEQVRLGGLMENFAAFEYWNNRYFVAHDHSCPPLGACYNLSTRDLEFKMTDNALHADKTVGNLGIKKEFHFSRNQNDVYYHEFFNDTIYYLSDQDQQFKSSLYVDFGSLKIDENLKRSGYFPSYAAISSYCAANNKTWGIHGFHVTSNGIVFLAFPKPDIRWILYDLHSKKGFSFDIKTSTIFLRKDPIATYKDYFVSFAESDFLYSASRPFFGPDSIKLRNEFADYYDLVKDVRPDTNYPLTFYKFKNL